MNILIVLNTLTVGGAEIFMLRFACALRSEGHEVQICVLRPDYFNKELCKTLASDLSVKIYHNFLLWQVLKIDGLLFRVGGGSLLRFLSKQFLKRIIWNFSPDIIHSNLLTCDLVVGPVCDELAIPWVTTIHGDYLGYRKIGKSLAARLKNFQDAVKYVDRSVSGVIYISEAQGKILKDLFPKIKQKCRLKKILNGYCVDSSHKKRENIALLNALPNKAFIIGMAARGIPEKGWDILLDAFTKLKITNSYLVLIGGSAYLDKLKKKYSEKNIIFTGLICEPQNYIRFFDIGCLPSRYSSESLPTFVVECLAYNVPVIATRVGEISLMLEEESPLPAGITLPPKPKANLSQELQKKMLYLYQHPEKLTDLKKGCSQAFKKFDMNYCVHSYTTLYRDVVQSSHSSVLNSN